MTVRVRCAPSPTGRLHLGVARTALFNELYARHHGGQFLLRIEDTDRERSKDEFVQSILEGLEWFGVIPDEPVIRQSERLDYYAAVIRSLVEKAEAYCCDCSKERLDEMRKAQLSRGETPHYDGHCRDRREAIAPGSVVRLKTPREGTLVMEDAVYGPTEFDLSRVDDFVIAKSDGGPTYQLAVVADDHDQRINLVIRGNDLMPSTPKQILLYSALGWETPRFAHLPMILGPDKQKLSKRHGATSLLAYRVLGYLPQAMRNYLVRLGWSHGDEEIFTPEELIKKFSLEGVSKSPAIFDPGKLLWVNGEHIRGLSTSELTDAWFAHLKSLDADLAYLEQSSTVDEKSIPSAPDLESLTDPRNRTWAESLVAALQVRSETLVQLTQRALPFLVEDIDYDPVAVRKTLKPSARAPLEKILDWVERHPDLPPEDAIQEHIVSVAESVGEKMGKVAQPVRVAVTGTTVSPPINTTLSLLGRARVAKRLRKGLELINE